MGRGKLGGGEAGGAGDEYSDKNVLLVVVEEEEDKDDGCILRNDVRLCISASESSSVPLYALQRDGPLFRQEGREREALFS